MTTEAILLVVIIVLLAGTLPVWPHSRSWGYAPTGVFTLLLVVLIFWALAGGRPLFRHSGGDIKSSMQNMGEDIKATGRDAAASIRRTVQ